LTRQEVVSQIQSIWGGKRMQASRARWRSLPQVELIEENDHISAFGVDSLTIAIFLTEIDEYFGVELDEQGSFFDNGLISSLVDDILRHKLSSP
jgi:acyl carrier protein